MDDSRYTQEEYLTEQIDALKAKIDGFKEDVQRMETIIIEMEKIESQPFFRTEGLSNSDHVNYLKLRHDLRHIIKTI